MDTSIEYISDLALAELRASGYMESTINEYRKHFRFLSIFADTHNRRQYTPETGMLFEKVIKGERVKCLGRYPRQIRHRCVKMLNAYLEYGDFGLDLPKPSNTEQPCSNGFRELLAKYISSLDNDGKSHNTIDSFRNVSCKYLRFLESRGIFAPDDATATTLHEFISDLRTTWSSGSIRTALSALRSFFMHTGNESLLCTVRGIRSIRIRKILPVLTDEEDALLWDALENSVEVSLRDKAIVMLCLVTGFRAVDVVRLCISDIDRDKGTLSVIQAKTGNPLLLPLLPAIGNKIADYIQRERPSDSGGILFLRSKAPHTALSGHSACYAIIRRTFRIAGISLDGRIGGTRLLRHNAASKLLRSEAPIETISAVLGHCDPDSTEIYITTDDIRMRECCLPLPSKMEVRV